MLPINPTDLCPLRLGQRVLVSPTYRHAADYRDTVYRITAMTHDYRRGAYDVNIAIATDEEIAAQMGSTDGFASTDLIPVAEPRERRERFETAFRAWFFRTGTDFWDEANAPEELAAIAVNIVENPQ